MLQVTKTVPSSQTTVMKKTMQLMVVLSTLKAKTTITPRIALVSWFNSQNGTSD